MFELFDILFCLSDGEVDLVPVNGEFVAPQAKDSSPVVITPVDEAAPTQETNSVEKVKKLF